MDWTARRPLARACSKPHPARSYLLKLARSGEMRGPTSGVGKGRLCSRLDLRKQAVAGRHKPQEAVCNTRVAAAVRHTLYVALARSL